MGSHIFIRYSLTFLFRICVWSGYRVPITCQVQGAEGRTALNPQCWEGQAGEMQERRVGLAWGSVEGPGDLGAQTQA